MMRAGHLRFLGHGFQDGIPVAYWEDRCGRRWKSFDLEMLRQMREDPKRETKTTARPERVGWHKGKQRR